MKSQNIKKSNRRSFFAAAGSSVAMAALIKFIPFSGFITKKTSAEKIVKAKVSFHPQAVKRNK